MLLHSLIPNRLARAVCSFSSFPNRPEALGVCTLTVQLYYTVYPVDLAELMMLEEFSTPHYLQSLPWRKLAAFFRSICQADDDGGGVNTRTSLCFPSRLWCLRPSGRVACTARTSQIFPRLGN